MVQLPSLFVSGAWVSCCISKAAKVLSSPSSPTTAGSPTTASDSSEIQLDKDPLVEDVFGKPGVGKEGVWWYTLILTWCLRVGCVHIMLGSSRIGKGWDKGEGMMMDFDLLLDIKSMIDEEKDDVYFLCRLSSKMFHHPHLITPYKEFQLSGGGTLVVKDQGPRTRVKWFMVWMTLPGI